MGAGRGRSRCALWGGISLGVGTLAFALFSSASVGCTTNLVLLTHGTVTARGCAAYSVMAHVGVGLIVLGAVLLLGSFALAVRSRRQGAALPAAGEAQPASRETAVRSPAALVPPVGPAVVAPGGSGPVQEPGPPAPVHPEPGPSAPSIPEPRPVVARTRPIAPGEDDYGDDYGDEIPHRATLQDSAVRLPPGWYGNPDIPGKPVQWWDGTRLTDRPG